MYMAHCAVIFAIAQLSCYRCEHELIYRLFTRPSTDIRPCVFAELIRNEVQTKPPTTKPPRATKTKVNYLFRFNVNAMKEKDRSTVHNIGYFM